LVQGEGGFTVASKKYVQYLRQFCTDNNIILIFDEVQSGFGRTGKWAAYEHYEVTPDLSTWAKSMGGGMPMGCVIGNAEIMDAIKPGLIGGTYLGNPICCAASLASINYMQKHDINAAGEKVGQVVLQKFKELQHKYPANITDVRGLGAMLAIEFFNPETGYPDGEITKNIVNKCHEKGLIIITSGTYGNCIRILSPLFIEDEILHKGLAILEESLTEILD
jgi:4-aminobutyrate aminotransferase / (S)-3-amino-2-methylpropionate transaminase / 5-aminovalerate transaminase